ncbi:hypothetical protein HYH03_005643 [Edaphochlamys debaryana]|uniref:FAD-dependent oxidoreductase domain-containing protein 1 n=1 Tax=Edaphochlamys debaryana TaxID=47281 RepID=A0A835Y7E0_9CHLO|nr:hypothetical protein HYH03_005643 [Edaphochlamys debaryana]|eukprot:KAG2496417.1 hypothetical protein HYH03_005643 [Edaphochlamys debaryana]
MRTPAPQPTTHRPAAAGARAALPRAVRPPTSRRPARYVGVRAAGSATDGVEADVVVVGSGIVGLFAASELLKAGLSVALLERKGLCAGATGAGQGYLWMAHRLPGSPGWALSARSIALWRRLVEAEPGLKAGVEWQDVGSLLVSTTPEESASLNERQLHLNEVGLRASYLDGRRMAEAEPGLRLPRGGAGLLVSSDLQINGHACAHAMLERCKAQPRFTQLFGPEAEVQGLELAGSGSGHVVRTAAGRVTARHALVMAAGVWSGALLSGATGEPGWAALLQPRRGHLLELPQPAHMPRVAHGMMEMSYTKHYATGGSAKAGGQQGAEPVDITFTATTSASGSLLIGSSREFSGWDTNPSPAIVSAILERAAGFLPGLQPAAEAAAKVAAGGGAGAGAGTGGGAGALEGMTVRVGLRPYAVGGLPLVGPVEGAPGLFLAAGHEGSGLCMGPATGELISRYVRKHIGATTGVKPPADAAAAMTAAGAPVKAATGGGSSLDTQSFEKLLPDVRRQAAAVKA